MYTSWRIESRYQIRILMIFFDSNLKRILELQLIKYYHFNLCFIQNELKQILDKVYEIYSRQREFKGKTNNTNRYFM